MNYILKFVALLFATFMFMASASPALAHHKDGHDKGKASVSQEDTHDNKHPSGKDRETNDGPADDQQGKSKSDPDDNGKGPDRTNGGADKPGGTGGVDKGDQDGNNGCGNDDDFEDDNEGRCGGKAKPVETSKPKPVKTDKPEPAKTNKPKPGKTEPAPVQVPAKPVKPVPVEPKPVNVKPIPVQNGDTPVTNEPGKRPHVPASVPTGVKTKSADPVTVFVAPVPDTPVAEVTKQELPYTGINAKQFIGFGVVLLLLGGLAYWLTGRTR